VQPTRLIGYIGLEKMNVIDAAFLLPCRTGIMMRRMATIGTTNSCSAMIVAIAATTM